MNQIFKCKEMESSIRDDGLIIPQKGECKMTYKENIIELEIIVDKEKILFNEIVEKRTIRHKVN